MKYIRVKDAEKVAPDYHNAPSISKTGSVRGMVKLYGWRPGHAIRIGSYIYHLTGQIYYDLRHLIRQ